VTKGEGAACLADVGNRADAGYGDVAPRELDGNGAAGLEALGAAFTAAASARLRGHESERFELFGEHVGDGIGEAAEHDRGGGPMQTDGRAYAGPLLLERTNRGECVHFMVSPKRRQTRKSLPRGPVLGRFGPRPARECLGAREHIQACRAFELREHVGDRRHPDHWVRSVAPAVRVRPR
jgi:hypothetical protein